MNITKRECATFIASPGSESLCQCGRRKVDHGDFVKHQHRHEVWSPSVHTKVFNTDAYGTVLFEQEHRKAHYVRLSYDTNPELVLQLMTYVWNVEPPKLIISVRGGSTNFEMSTRLGKIFQTGLIKAAKSTNAWVFTNGLNSGVAKHVGSALNNERWVGGNKRGKVISVGIPPWGLVEARDDLTGRNRDKVYSPMEHAQSKLLQLNSRHSNFILVDNGSIGKFGGENYLRRRLEKCIASHPISPNRGCDTPVVVVVLEGGFYTLRQITDYLYDEPPVPVIIFSATGRTADLVAWVLRKVHNEHEFEKLKDEIYHKIIHLFNISINQCSFLYKELKSIYMRKSLITVFNPNATTSEDDFDAAILSSIFRSQHWTPLQALNSKEMQKKFFSRIRLSLLQQLSLTLVWDRVDIADAEVFIYGREWSRDHLEQAMMEALVSNRLDFVNLLLEHGLNMQSFLTASRLEFLYSLDKVPTTLILSLLSEFAKIRANREKRNSLSNNDTSNDLTLHDVGVALSHMMGHVFKSRYVHIVAKLQSTNAGTPADREIQSQTFLQPFDDLFIWAVITKRHEMSKLLWPHGQGALAKALVAVKLNKYLAGEINALEKSFTNVSVEYVNYSEEWENLALSLLDSCYRSDGKLARQLLTMELECFSKQTCLSLAVFAQHRMLLGHPCCQLLLADLWMGALNIKSNATLKIMLGIFCPPLAILWEYKSTEELKMLPHEEKDESYLGGSATDREKDSSPVLLTTGRFHTDPVSNCELISLKSDTDPIESKMLLDSCKESTVLHQRKTDLATVVNTVLANLREHKHLQGMQSGEHGEAGEKLIKTGYVHVHNVGDQTKESLRTDVKAVVNNYGRVSNFVTTKQSLRVWSKFVEFQKSPVTNFYRHMFAYVAFVIAFAYVILYPQDPDNPGWVECYVISYFVTNLFECIRDFLHIEALSFSQRLSGFQQDFWQFGDFVASCVCLFVAVVLRFVGHFEYGMLTYKISSIYWNLRLYKYLGAHRFVGPKIVMMRRMLTHMVYFATIILVIIISFGMAREAIRFPNLHPELRDIAEGFLEPYVMMFGEVDLDALTPPCGDDDDEYANCPVGYWIIPFAWIVYMLVANILIVNVLIAVFNGIYQEIDAIAVEVWMFHRFNFVMEFEQKPILPPPFIILCHIRMVLISVYKRFFSCLCEEELLESSLEDDDRPHIIMGNNDHRLKTFLSKAEQSIVFDFEEDNVDNLMLLYKDKNVINTPDAAMAYRLGIGTEKFTIQQMKVGLGELHAEMESQKAKLEKLIGYWEMDMASNQDDGDGKKEGKETKPSAGQSEDAISTATSLDALIY
ncbi:Transient receptor potential cation channel trpm [Orchesella cincta]|uniref:Transient receptor potential cation channel trpm n=1 Tax=Orchesella cincta TaxID=48709 RepID=A0A1D2NL52_ORCCI|nr:Transient receptor potential cation channel trpm [Orchesella cincta]